MLLDHRAAASAIEEARELARVRVQIRYIRDWVVDYSEPGAVWVISDWAWYRCALWTLCLSSARTSIHGTSRPHVGPSTGAQTSAGVLMVTVVWLLLNSFRTVHADDFVHLHDSVYSMKGSACEQSALGGCLIAFLV